jgi:hypothetical protein
MTPVRILLAIVAIVLVAAPSGCGGGGDPSPAEARLIAKADAICASSQKAMEELSEEFPKGERADGILRKIDYAEGLVGISELAAEKLAALDPPQSIRAEYEEYVESQRQVYYEDMTMAHGGHAFHLREYFAANERRDRVEQKGQELAGDLGLEGCAGPA